MLDFPNLAAPQSGLKRLAAFGVSGTFIVPDNVHLVYLSGCAGGYGGAQSTLETAYINGSASNFYSNIPVSVTPGESIPVVIGQGGVISTDINPVAGGHTYFGALPLRNNVSNYFIASNYSRSHSRNEMHYYGYGGHGYNSLETSASGTAGGNGVLFITAPTS